MENEQFVKTFAESGTADSVAKWLRYLREKELYHLGIMIGEFLAPYFFHDTNILDELGMCYYYAGYHKQSWELYNDILSSGTLSRHKSNAYSFNAHFNIPHIENQYTEYPEDIVKSLVARRQPIPLVTFTITTCKRFDLFEKTMNSFLNCCEDVHLISNWICVDDNSSTEDRKKMQEKYPFFNFYFKSPEEKGHAQSMNILLRMIQTPYVFHMEDDWQFYSIKPYIKQCIEVLNHNSELGQCLVNKNYAETHEDIKLIGGIFNKTEHGLRYYVHDHDNDEDSFRTKYGNGFNCAYWPHYSLRPGITKTEVFRKIGLYKPEVAHFEMEYARRYIQQGYKTAFLDTINAKHIGRLTKDRNDKSKINAYTLNDEKQFVDKNESQPVTEEQPQGIEIRPLVINLDSRPDRMESFVKQVQDSDVGINFIRVPAIDGYKLQSTRQLEQLFNPNDYNYRRGMIGCALSHISLWIKLCDEKALYLILEDDVEFVPDFQLKLRQVVLDTTKADPEWDIIFLGHHLYEQYQTSKSYNKQLIPKTEKWDAAKSLQQSRGGTGGYIINPKGALGMLSFIQERGMTNGIDTMMQKAADRLKIYYCEPHLIYSECMTSDNIDSVDSDIQKNYDSLKVDVEERIQNEIKWFNENSDPHRFLGPNESHADDGIISIGQEGSQQSYPNTFSYLIDKRPVHIPASKAEKYFKNYRLLNDGRVSNEFLIKFEES